MKLSISFTSEKKIHKFQNIEDRSALHTKKEQS